MSASTANTAEAPARKTAANAITPNANLVAVIDGAQIVSAVLSPVAEGLASVKPEAAARLGEIEARCGFKPWQAIGGAVLFGQLPSGPDQKRWMVLAIEPTVEAQLALTCMAALGEHTERAGWIEAPKFVATASGPLLLLGTDRAHVQAAVDQLNSGGPVHALAPTQRTATVMVRYLDATHPKLRDLELDVWQPEPQGATSARITFADERGAVLAERTLQASLEKARGEIGNLPLRVLASGTLESVQIARSGATLNASVVLPSLTVEQLGLIAALATKGFERYVSRAKQSEARFTLRQIAMRLTPNGGKLPASAPRVPAQVPPGKKVVASAADWNAATWQSIDFRMEGGQFYSYEIETAPDGKSAVIRAIGDLDADGEFSTLELAVRIEEANGEPSLIIGPEFTETNPDE